MFPPEVRRYGGMTAEFKATSQHIPVELLKKISFRLEGHWAPDSKEENEKIFVAEKATEILPETESEVCKFLMRNCSSLGKTMANHIVERFGMNTLDVCAHHCKQLFDIPRIDDKVIAKLNDHNPSSIGQASRISGITPAAISILLSWVFPGGFTPPYGAGPTFALHWAMGIAAYGLFGAAVLHGILLWTAERSLHRRKGAPGDQVGPQRHQRPH